MNLSQAINPLVQNALIVVASGLVASVLCAKVYGATLPLEEPATAETADAPDSALAPRLADEAAAAAWQLAMQAVKSVFLGPPDQVAPGR
jgi:hypothetical protein